MSVTPPVISVSSLEYVRVRVQARESGVLVNPTADTVTMAFKTSGTPTAPDFKTSSWETDASDPSNPKYYARCLVGTGGAATLTADVYSVWVKIVDSPETPIIKAGRLVVEA